MPNSLLDTYLFLVVLYYSVYLSFMIYLWLKFAPTGQGGFWSLASWQHIRSCQDGYRLVAARTHSDIIVLPHWELTQTVAVLVRLRVLVGFTCRDCFELQLNQMNGLPNLHLSHPSLAFSINRIEQGLVCSG